VALVLCEERRDVMIKLFELGREYTCLGVLAKPSVVLDEGFDEMIEFA
jgi:hypothetical protein